MLNKLRLLTPGPTPLPEEVRLSLARDMIHHRKKIPTRFTATPVVEPGGKGHC